MPSGSSPPPRRKTRDQKPVHATATDLRPPPAPTIAEAEDRGDIHRRATVNMQAVVAPPVDIHRRATIDMEAVHGPPRAPKPRDGAPRRQLDSVDVQAEWMDDAASEVATREAVAAEEDEAKRVKAPPPWEPAPLPPPPATVARKRPVTSPIPREDDGPSPVVEARAHKKPR